MVNHFLYLPSSHAAVTIKNQPYISIIMVMNAKNQRNQFNAVSIKVKKPVFQVLPVSAQATHILLEFWLPNHHNQTVIASTGKVNNIFHNKLTNKEEISFFII